SFYVLNSLLGLRSDFASAMRAVVGAQAALTVILAAMAPITEIVYLSGCDYNDAILFNGLIFAVGSVGGQVVLRRLYQPLIARDHRHRWTLIAWLVIYVFVGIQMGWVLRPFIGDPTLPTQFLRPEALTNAYTSVMHIIWKGIQ
ncbi:MAG TPA: hypothetical protein VG722_07050, partial [Tepidisphaeraceae bacterium]|nr:hypothetical protein [Tepidisphaeraceae bacterium]